MCKRHDFGDKLRGLCEFNETPSHPLLLLPAFAATWKGIRDILLSGQSLLVKRKRLWGQKGFGGEEERFETLLCGVCVIVSLIALALWWLFPLIKRQSEGLERASAAIFPSLPAGPAYSPPLKVSRPRLQITATMQAMADGCPNSMHLLKDVLRTLVLRCLFLFSCSDVSVICR